MSVSQDPKIIRATRDIERGRQHPYDSARDKDYAVDWSVIAARGIMADLSDRTGIKDKLAVVDPFTRNEMIDSMASIIRVAFTSDPGFRAIVSKSTGI